MTTENYDLIIVGSGSGNSLISDEMDGWKIAIVERWTFGGTCLNRGCVPSKMFVYAADVAESAANDNGPKYGVTTNFESADWPSMVRRVFGRIDPIAEGGRSIDTACRNVTVYEGNADLRRRADAWRSTVRRSRGDRIVIATGARSFIPNIHGIDEVPVPHQRHHHAHRPSAEASAWCSAVGSSPPSSVTSSARSARSVTIINRGHQSARAPRTTTSRTRYTELAAERFELLLGAHGARAST